MKVAGETRPRSGCIQRDKASKAITRRLASNSGWKCSARLSCAQRQPEVLLERTLLAQVVVHAHLEHAESATTLVLGAVERDVGVLHQVDRGQAIGREDGDADAGADGHGLVVEDELGGEAVDQAARHLDRVLGLLAAGLEDGEFVAAEAGHDVAVAQVAAQALGHLAEQLVAGGMAQRVVHALEAVEIEAEHRDRRLRLLGELEGEQEVVVQLGAVGEPGERVVMGEEADALLGLAALANVAECGDAGRQPAIVDRARDDLDGKPLAARGHDFGLGRDRIVRGLGGVPPCSVAA